jgi:hypothetical protein
VSAPVRPRRGCGAGADRCGGPTSPEFLEPADYPALTAVHAAETADDPPNREPPGEDALPFELSFGVDRFLDGVEVWVAEKGRPS